MTFRAILLLNLWFARDMPLLAERGWWEGRRKEVEEKIGKEERNVRGGGRVPVPWRAWPGINLLPWQLSESFSRRAISLSYYNASLKHNPNAEHFRQGGRAGWMDGEKRGYVCRTSGAQYIGSFDGSTAICQEALKLLLILHFIMKPQ